LVVITAIKLFAATMLNGAIGREERKKQKSDQGQKS
jgi:hypothetical protein